MGIAGVPYTGAGADVDLGANTLIAEQVTQGPLSGPILLANITDAALTAAVEVAVVGDYAYTLGGQRFAVIDVTDPTAPVVVGSINDAASFDTVDVAGLAVTGGYAYCGSRGKFTIVDVSNPAAPVVVSVLTSASFSSTDPLSVCVAGKHALVASGRTNALFISIDISNPATPVIVDSVSFYALGAASGGNTSFVNGIGRQGRYAYIAIGTGETTTVWFQVYDVIDPTNLVLLSQVELTTAIGDLVTDICPAGRYVYAGGDFGTLWSVDVSDPANPVSIEYPIGYSRSIHKYGDYLYGVAYFAVPGIASYDISDPTVAPVLLGATASPFGSTVIDHGLTSIRASGRYGYTLANNQNRFLVYDIHGCSLASAHVGALRSSHIDVEDLSVTNNVSVHGGLNVGSPGVMSHGPISTEEYIQTKAMTVTDLPVATTVGAGARSVVTDATATTFMSVVAGGGASVVPVWCDGTNWLIG